MRIGVSWMKSRSLDDSRYSEREDRTFRTLFTELKAGKFDCNEVIDELKCTTLLQVLVGKDKDTLTVTSGSQSVFNVCEEFVRYVNS